MKKFLKFVFNNQLFEQPDLVAAFSITILGLYTTLSLLKETNTTLPITVSIALYTITSIFILLVFNILEIIVTLKREFLNAWVELKYRRNLKFYFKENDISFPFFKVKNFNKLEIILSGLYIMNKQKITAFLTKEDIRYEVTQNIITAYNSFSRPLYKKLKDIARVATTIELDTFIDYRHSQLKPITFHNNSSFNFFSYSFFNINEFSKIHKSLPYLILYHKANQQIYFPLENIEQRFIFWKTKTTTIKNCFILPKQLKFLKPFIKEKIKHNCNIFIPNLYNHYTESELDDIENKIRYKNKDWIKNNFYENLSYTDFSIITNSYILKTLAVIMKNRTFNSCFNSNPFYVKTAALNSSLWCQLTVRYIHNTEFFYLVSRKWIHIENSLDNIKAVIKYPTYGTDNKFSKKVFRQFIEELMPGDKLNYYGDITNLKQHHNISIISPKTTFYDDILKESQGLFILKKDVKTINLTRKIYNFKKDEKILNIV